MLRLFILFFLISTQYSFANEHFKPNRDWQTLEGTHAVINYPSSLFSTARSSLKSADHIIPQLSAFLDWSPEQKVQLVISDQHDFANGYATPMPYNRSVLFITLPSGLNELQDYSNWLDTLILHELTHIVHLDKSHDWAYFPRYIFGRNPLTFPNLFQPNFLKEGLATYIETDWAKGTGRGQSAFYNMVMRTEASSGLLPLGKVQQFTRDWPLNKSYSYGVYFYQFIDEVYGQESITRYIEATSGQLIPFIVDRPARHASFKSGLDPLWTEFGDWLNKKFAPQLAMLKETTTDFEKLTNTGYANASPIISADGSVYYVAFDPYGPSTISTINASGEHDAIIEVPSSTQLAAIDNGELLYLQPAPCHHNTYSVALYRYDVEASSREQLMDCTHYTGAAKRANQLAAIKVTGPNKSLVLTDLETLEEALIYKGANGINFGSVIWENDHTLLVTNKPANTAWVLSRLDLSTGELSTILAKDNINIFEVSQGPSADKLILTTDSNQGIELWEFSIGKQLVRSLTHSIGGATQGRYNPANDSLVYRAYTEAGWDIATTPYSPQTGDFNTEYRHTPGTGFALNDVTHATNNSTAVDQSAIDQIADKVDNQAKDGPQGATINQDKQLEGAIQHNTSAPNNTHARPYNALSTVAPRSWFFGYTADNAQTTGSIAISGRDALNFHNWGLLAGRDFDNSLNLVQGVYTAYNHLSFLYSRDNEYTVGNERGPAPFVDKARAYETDETFAILAHTQFHIGLAPLSLVAGFNQDEKDYTDLVNQTNNEKLKVKTSGLGLRFSTARKALYGISLSHGRSIQINLEHDSVLYNTPTNIAPKSTSGGVWTLDWSEYIQLYKAHTLVLHALVGEAEQGADFFDLTDSPDISLYKQATIHRREYPLRGYPDSTRELSGYKPKITSVDYRFPIAYIDQGISAWPLGLHSLSGAIFYETGKADTGKATFEAAGAEFNIGLDLGYSALPVSLKAGVAFPFDETTAAPQKDPNYYIGLGYSL